jgi:thiol-disulfide isomerase/thioredoxin
MKKKYFFIGFLASIVLTGIILFIGFRFVKSEREEMLAEDNAKEVEEISYSIINLNQKDLLNLGLTYQNNKSVDLESKNYVFLNFWATWCMPCVAEMPSIKLMKENYNSNNTIAFFFASEEPFEKVVKFENKRKFGFDYITFQKKHLPKFLSIDLIPTTFIFDTKNLICYKISGSANYNSVTFKKFLKSIVKT